MVLSKITNEISYQELKTIDENDKGRDVSMYEINLFNIPVVIALGEIKYTFVDQNILFVPVYLVVDTDNKIYQIGVYEFPSEKLENIKDEEGDLDISNIDGPLLYSFINKPYVEKCMKNENLVPDYDSGDEEGEEEDDEEDEGDEEGDEGKSDSEEELEDIDDVDDDNADDDDETSEGLKNPPPVLVELLIEDDDDDFSEKGEQEKDEKKEKKKYKKSGNSESEWIEHYMNNNNYGIIDNPGHGDCFFYTIRDAFKSINIDGSVKKTREILTNKVDENVFNTYKEKFTMINKELKTLSDQIPKDKKRKAKLASDYNKLVKDAKGEKDIPTQKLKRTKAKQMRKKHKELSEELKAKERELKYAKNNYTDIKWFKNVKTKEQLISKMKTCDFWADIWAISTLEIGLNTKFIILSSDEYKRGNYGAVLRCGDFVPNSIEDKKYFKPKYYIILEHTGNHYKLITYKEKHIHRFHDIPFGMRRRIVEKCMKSKGKSLYNYIPKFAKMIGETIEIPKKEDGEENKSEEKMDSPIIVVETETSIEEEEEEVMQTPTPQDENLFNDDTVFYFREGSADKKPGKSIGKTMHEKIKDEDKFKDLEKIKDWRKVLSNMHYNGADYVVRKEGGEDGEVEPLFELDGLKWASVEHYYHANKFKKNTPDYYKQFAIDSGSAFAFEPKKALGAGGKGGKVREKNPETKKVKIIFSRPRDIVMDEDFFDGRNPELVMERAQQAKYEQDDLSKRVLLATKDAKLIHHIKPRGAPRPSIVFYNTMRVRHKLKKKN
uniref:NADAR domain-containing protein n=1 Tax=viral metagenome TaxID=1070528 RepID=A0A6C0JCD7_9ZZZZ